MKVKGIHHISNIVGHPQSNIDFYTSVLGLRLIKKAVNFDDANTYHFYYGNNEGNIGSIITSFPYVGEVRSGIKGGGQVVSIYYIIPKGSISFWERRLNLFKIKNYKKEVFGKTHLVFKDDSGIKIELVESNLGDINTYEYNGIKKTEAIKGFYGAGLYSIKPEETKKFFVDVLKMNLKEEDESLFRFELDEQLGRFIDLDKIAYKKGRLSVGTVHHLALTVETLDDLVKFKEHIESLGMFVTEVKDRDFFGAIYFREPGGINIELSTRNSLKENVDIKIDDTASELYLPKHYEEFRSHLEETLIPIFVKPVKELKEYKYQTKEQYDDYYYHQGLLTKINEYAQIAKKRDLTVKEAKERQVLREEYLNSFRKGFVSLIDTISIEDENGNVNKVERKKK